MNLRDKQDKEKIASDKIFDDIGITHVENTFPIGEEINRMFKFNTLTDFEKMTLILRKFDYLQYRINDLKSKNEKLEKEIKEIKTKDFWKEFDK